MKNKRIKVTTACNEAFTIDSTTTQEIISVEVVKDKPKGRSINCRGGNYAAWISIGDKEYYLEDNGDGFIHLCHHDETVFIMNKKSLGITGVK